MAQIEPIEIFGCENKGVFLKMYGQHPFGDNKTLKAEITDVFGNVLFTRILVYGTIEEVAQQLNLKLKTDTVDNTKELLTEIMEADAKDGLYEQEQIMYSEEEVIELIQFLSMDEDFNGYGSVSKETANYFLEQFKKGLENPKTTSEEPNASHIIRAYQDGTKDGFDAPHFGSGLNYYRETFKKQ